EEERVHDRIRSRDGCETCSGRRPGKQACPQTQGSASLTPVSPGRKCPLSHAPRPRWPFGGAVAQLGERLVRNEEVRGSTPLGSTTPKRKTFQRLARRGDAGGTSVRADE